jgi:predicted ATP-binding protein involved in virulence
LIGGKGEEKKIIRVGNDLESRNAKRSLLRGFAAYGIHRTVIKSNYFLPRRNHELSKNGFLESILNDGITPLIDFNKTLEEWTESENSLEKFYHRRDFFAKALLRTVPGLVDIHFTNSRKGLTSDFFIRFDDGPVSKVSYDQLSSGTKSILSFVADIIVRFYKQQPEAYDPSEFRGIVIVDEIDLHLHPQGQRNIILALSEVFPNIQFIVSTHSPIPLLGAPVNSVFCVVTRNAVDGNNIVRLKKLEKEIKYLTPNTILTSDIFAFDFFNEMSNEKFGNLYLEDNYDEIIKNKEIDERLSKLSNDFLPENLF